jgi:cyclic-di-GMP-binding protein
LLIAISNPYRLTQKEIHETHLLTRVWASQVRAAGAENPRAFSVPVDEDAGPGYLPEERRTGGGTARYDTASLEHELDRQLTLSAGIGGALSFRLKSAAAVAVSPDLVRRLVQSWQPQAARTHTRLPAGHELETLLGLHAIHYHLAGAVDFETFVRRTCGAVHFQERERAASWTAQGGDGSKPESFRATVLDQGLGGYRVEWDKVESVRARVGEIVAMTLPIEEGDEADWMVGIIRWLRIDPQGKVDAGIELLTRHARAAVLRAVDTAGHPKPPVRALRLNPVRATAPQDPPYSVVVPSVVERGAPKYELITVPERYADDDEAEVDVIASVAVLDSSGTYVRLAPRQDPVAAERDPLVANG